MQYARPITSDPWLSHLIRHVRYVREGRDSESVHQIRVAIARLRVWLALGGWRVLDDDLRWLRDEAAVVRDIEVQLEQHPPDRWAVDLRERQARALRRLRRALNSERAAATIEALRTMPPVRREVAYRRAQQLAHRALARGGALDAAADVSALHALRCALRRLRYALEWLGEDSTSIAALQQLLGDACDRYVALKGLRKGATRRGERRYRRRLERELDHLVARAFAKWKSLRPSVQELSHATVRHSSRSGSSSLTRARRRFATADGPRSPPVAARRARIPAARSAA